MLKRNKTPYVKFVLGLLGLICLGAWPSLAQIRLSGYVRDASSGESISAANLRLFELQGRQQDLLTETSTNVYGFFSLALSKNKLAYSTSDSLTLEISHIGYRTLRFGLDQLKRDTNVVLFLEADQRLEEVLVRQAGRSDWKQSAQMGLARVRMQDVKKVPILFGEQDIIKTLQLLPGIMSGNEGSSTLYVRGGMGDQNLILLDGAPVFNASHLFGFFSTFNSDAIRSVDLYKGEMPAEYGGRLASVLDIHMQEGNNQSFHAEGGIGLIASRLKLEGPLARGRSSFMISGRRTYADLFLKLSPDETVNQSELYFYDLNLKTNYQVNQTNRVFLSAYFGRDRLGYADVFRFGWGNATASFRWNSQWSHRLFSNMTAVFSEYRYQVDLLDAEMDFNIASHIRGYHLKQDVQYSLFNAGTLRFGWDAHLNELLPVSIQTGEAAPINHLEVEDKRGAEISLYSSHEWNITPKLQVIYGVRGSRYLMLGPGIAFDFESGTGFVERVRGLDFDYKASDFGLQISASDLPRGNHEVLTSYLGKPYGKWDVIQAYWRLEPRVSVRWTVNSRSSLKAAFARHSQYIHQLSNATSSLPTDAWVLSSNNVKPQQADQYSIGYYYNWTTRPYNFSLETYYKDLFHQMDYRDGADLPADDHIDAELVFGIGRAYGVEALFKKERGAWNGWLAYSWSKSERLFEHLNQGNWFHARQDRTHDLSAVLVWQFNPVWSLSSTLVYSTGHAVTYPSGRYRVDGKTIWYYSERNGYRMPDYHRMDLALQWENRRDKRFSSSWNVGLYNVYNRKNAYLIEFREGKQNPQQTEIYRVALFGVVPSITWNFKF